MIWQDVVLALGSIALTFVLLPSLLGKNKPALATSFISGLVLISFGLVYWTLTLWISSIASIAQGIIWMALAYQKRRSLQLDVLSGSPRPPRRSKGRVRIAKSV